MNSLKPEFCLNCKTRIETDQEYCPVCGQRVLPEHLTTGYFLKEFLNNYFSFDSRFLKTLKPLLFKPSWLTHEFIRGRRIRYINPVQLFIFSSFIYFLVDSLVFVERPEKKDLVVFSSNGTDINSDSLDRTKIDSLLLEDNDSTMSRSILNHFLRRAYKFNQLDRASQNAIISKTLSYAIFFLTPIFALYLRLFFKKKDSLYLENLIFSLHFHAFYFVLATIFLILGRIFPFEFIKAISYILITVYIFIALQSFYSFSWKSTLARFTGLFILYSFTVILFFLGSVVLSVFLS